MSENARITTVLVVALLLVVGFIGYQQLSNQDSGSQTPDGNPASGELLVRADSHYLSRGADERVTVVEFLDFECEACLAMYPVMEEIRSEYAGRINFVVRYFPLPGHPNSMTAATAVEAAAQQGAFEPMYRKMYDTQTEWGHNQESQLEVFVGFAAELGLDVAAFEQAMDDPATEARVQRDIDDGTALGVGGTPTIFINGVQTPSMPSKELLVSTIEAAMTTGPQPVDEGEVPLAIVRRVEVITRFGDA